MFDSGMVSTLLAHLGLLQQATHWRTPPPQPDSGGVHHAKHGSYSRSRCFHPHLVVYCCAAPPAATTLPPPPGTGLNAKGKKTLAHPDYHLIQAWWHPTLNKGKQPADFPHKTRQRVWLCCPGCTHGCGRQHQWEASIRNLTRGGGSLRCPYCESRGRGGSSCECRSVAEDARLSREWHPDNPTPPHPGGQEQRQEIPVDVSQGS